MDSRPTLLLHDPDPRSRLKLISQLRDAFRILPLQPGDSVLRQARSQQPDLVLLVLPYRDPHRQLRTCLSLRTDLRPSRVAVLDPYGVIPPEQIRDEYQANGVAQGELPAPALLRWSQATLREQSWEISTTRRSPGLLRRFFRS